MKLTGKCKYDFESWFKNNKPKDFLFFDKLPLSMQFGVIQDFAESKGMTIIIDADWHPEGVNVVNPTFDYYIHHNDGENGAEFNCNIKTRTLARIESVEKFNEIYNSQMVNSPG